MISKILKDGAEKAGIDDKYLKAQHDQFKSYQDQREKDGHPRPLGLGVMMWDEVKDGAYFCYCTHLLRITQGIDRTGRAR